MELSKEGGVYGWIKHLWIRIQFVNGEALRNEQLNERLYKGEVEPWYAVKKLVWDVFPSSKLYKDWKEK